MLFQIPAVTAKRLVSFVKRIAALLPVNLANGFSGHLNTQTIAGERFEHPFQNQQIDSINNTL